MKGIRKKGFALKEAGLLRRIQNRESAALGELMERDGALFLEIE